MVNYSNVFIQLSILFIKVKHPALNLVFLDLNSTTVHGSN